MMKTLFIIGMPRSGTKLLRDALNSIDGIYIPPVETEFMIKFHDVFQKYATVYSARELVSVVYRDLIEGSAFNDFLSRDFDIHLDLQEWSDQYERFLRTEAFKSECAALFFSLIGATAVAEKRGLGRAIVVLGDKSPSYIYIPEFIRAEFSGSYILLLVRDPRDLSVSNRRAWNKSVIRTAWRWKTVYPRAMSVFEVKKEKFRIVRYEDFISAPSTALRSLCHWLGVEYQEDWGRRLRVVENLGDTIGFKGVAGSNMNKFREKIPGWKLKWMEAILGDNLDRFGYHAVTNRQGIVFLKILAIIVLPGLWINDAYHLILYEVKRRGLAGIAFRLRYYFNSGSRS